MQSFEWDERKYLAKADLAQLAGNIYSVRWQCVVLKW